MKKQYFFRFLFLFCSLIFAQSAIAQSKQVISRADIEAFGYQRLEQLLSTEVLGLEINWAGQSVASVSMQGENGQRTLFIVDGVRQASFGGGLTDLSKMPLYSIEKIEITKGAASVEYGSGAMASVINITTRKAAEGTPGHQVEVFGRAGTSGSGNLSNDKIALSKEIKNVGAGLYAGFSTKKFSSTTSASYLSDNGYLLASNYAGGAVAAEAALNATQDFGYRFSKHVKAEVKGRIFNKKSYLYNAGKSSDINSLDGLSYGFDATVIYDIDTLNKIVFSASADYYKLTRQLNSAIDEGNTKHHYFTPSVVWYGRPHKNHNVTAGIEVRQEGLSNTLSSGTSPFDDTFNTFSFYVRDKIKFTNKLSGSAGIRVEAFGINDFMDLYESFVGKPKALDRLSVSPELELSYNLNQFNITAFYSMGYRNPTLLEHSGASQTAYGMLPIVPINYSLNPERNNYISLEGNYSTKNEMFKTSLKIYESLYIHQIEATEPTRPNGYFYFANMGSGSTYGVEWLGEVEPLTNWRIKAGYSYVGQSQNSDRSIFEERFYYLRPHAATLSTAYKIAKGDFSYHINIAGKYLSSISGENWSAPGYGVVNAAISARYKKLITLTLGGENLLNQQVDAPLYATPIIKGINGYAQLAINF